MAPAIQPTFDLSGRHVLIPGGTGSVGEGIVRAYLGAGAEVIVPSRTTESAERFRALLDDTDTSRLHLLVGDYTSFAGAEEMARRIDADFGSLDDVVASIGGWWSGKAVWEIDEDDWNSAFVSLSTAHIASVRAFLPRLSPRGAYTLILGGSAHTPATGSGIVSMEQAALMMLRNVLELEAGDQRRIFSLILGPVLNRNRPDGDPDWVSADQAGAVSVAASVSTHPGLEIRMNSQADVAQALATLGTAGAASTQAGAGMRLPTGWPELDATLAAIAVGREDREYEALRSTYMRVGTPTIVFRPGTEPEASAVIRYAAAVRQLLGDGVKFSVRSGGHGIGGHSTNTGGILLDMSRIAAIEVTDPDAGLVTVQAGARWGAVARALTPHDLVISSGNFGDTGVGGLATAGGVGYFVRAHGMTLDHIVGATLITADGTIHQVDAENEPDLFWGIRGGATQLGVVTEFKFRAHKIEATAVIHQEVNQLVDDLAEFTERWGALLQEAPHELTSFTMIQGTGDGRYSVNSRNVWANQDIGAARESLQQYLDLAPVMNQTASYSTYADIVPSPGWQHQGQQQIHMRNVLLPRVDRQAGKALEVMLAGENSLVAELRSLGGAVNEVAADETAWAHRHHQGLVSLWANPGDTASIDASWDPVLALGTGAYGAYSSETGDAVAALAWPGETGARLRRLALAHDPQGLFSTGLVLRG